jgi:hypothetical protein
VAHQLELRVADEVRNILLATGEIIVEANDVIAFGKHALAKVRTQKAAASGDEHSFSTIASRHSISSQERR